jgi:hypothetical protein
MLTCIVWTARMSVQVAAHCSTALTDRRERTSKFGQKFVRAGVLRPLCALLALSVPRSCVQPDAGASRGSGLWAAMALYGASTPKVRTRLPGSAPQVSQSILALSVRTAALSRGLHQHQRT